MEELLAKYLSGKCTPAEVEQVKQWLKDQGEEWMEKFMEEHWDQQPQHSTPEVRQQLADQIITATVKRKRMFFLRIATAACVAVIAAAACWLLIPSLQEPVRWELVSNTGKDLKKIQLPDASVVTLNRNTTIRYSSAYNKKERRVLLEGEAFFEIAPDANRPFLVQAGNAITRVYGTAFNVNAVTGAGEIRVALQQGKISVTCDSLSGEKMMTPGQLLVYNRQSHKTDILPIAPETADSWRKGQLNFVNTPMHDVLLQLENTYGVHFVHDNNIRQQQTVTAVFPAADLPKVLQHLAFIWDLQFRQQGDSIYIK
ncbi:MAG TPA: FecR domain-containing protein [Chitinophaga sp.]|uniref:FecR family protein n=1 Tax=Chitinophaga sp. TaxID=1869181 RepID=UPI002BA638A5|nr:FecR domain-containing protein [Chitinophaga sp.]HVI45261.1 FecR domain-containing protein [Chitinophaga sp.]